jgi:hypothetical protein
MGFWEEEALLFKPRPYYVSPGGIILDWNREEFRSHRHYRTDSYRHPPRDEWPRNPKYYRDGVFRDKRAIYSNGVYDEFATFSVERLGKHCPVQGVKVLAKPERVFVPLTHIDAVYPIEIDDYVGQFNRAVALQVETWDRRVALLNDYEYFADQFGALVKAFGTNWPSVYRPEHVLRGRYTVETYRSWHYSDESDGYHWVPVYYAHGDLYKPAAVRAASRRPRRIEWK